MRPATDHAVLDFGAYHHRPFEQGAVAQGRLPDGTAAPDGAILTERHLDDRRGRGDGTLFLHERSVRLQQAPESAGVGP